MLQKQPPAKVAWARGTSARGAGVVAAEAATAAPVNARPIAISMLLLKLLMRSTPWVGRRIDASPCCGLSAGTLLPRGGRCDRAAWIRAHTPPGRHDSVKDS